MPVRTGSSANDLPINRKRRYHRRWYRGCVPAAKPTISLDPELRDQIEAAAASAGVSFSAWMADAARQRLRKERVLGIIAEWEAEHGEFTEAEIAAVRTELGIGKRRPKKTA
jgi:hypothetical protein